MKRFLMMTCAGILLLSGVRPSSAGPLNLIQLENRQPGTTAWQLTNPADNRQIEGYASLTSVPVGGDIRLFVSTADKTYSLTVFRMGWYGGTGGRKVLGPQMLPGVKQVTPDVDPTTEVVECQWTKPFVIHVPSSWLSGIYLVKLHANTSGKESYIIFTVRDARRADLVFQQSVLTYHAYNPWPGYDTVGREYTGQSLYDFATKGGKQAKTVSMDRPYGLVERSFANPLPFYSRSVSLFYGIGAGDFLQNLAPASMDYGMVRWLERQGYDVTYITDVDTHEDVGRLLRAKAYLSVGHDEYVTREMKAHMVQARDQGVSLGFFGANYVYWPVGLLPDSSGTPNRRITLFANCVNKDTGIARSETECVTDDDCTDGNLCKVKLADYSRTLDANGVSESEQALVGGMWDPGAAITGGGDIFLAPDSLLDHWVFANTGLQVGDSIPGIIGSEYDYTSVDPLFPSPDGLQVLVHTQVPNFGAGLPGFPLPQDFDGDFNSWYESIAAAPRHCGNDASKVCTPDTVVDDCCTTDACRAKPPSCEQLTVLHCSDDASKECTAKTVKDDCCTDDACRAEPPACVYPCDRSPISPLGRVPDEGFCSNPFPYYPGLRTDWAMTIYQAPSGAWVFNAATNEWAWGLDDYFTGLKTPDGANNGPALRVQCGYPWFHPGLVSCRNPAVEQITRNVLNRFIAGF
ncbi:MAG TPA: N,N-dimethylformamidase beta subunit family domain-containing protein [Candidatus Polarisedimenticolia bacterium]|nr:N,N-dimethylformamidase beta subunit family domain-containing protein [Candidatus Polarisedimenticolia bacterium]